jgi:hypothetical protein
MRTVEDPHFTEQHDGHAAVLGLADFGAKPVNSASMSFQAMFAGVGRENSACRARRCVRFTGVWY